MKPGKRFGLSAEQKSDVWRRWKAGQTLHEIGRAFGKEHSSIRCLVSRHGGIAPAVRRRALLALTLREREEISRIGILGFQPTGNLLRRPVQNQFTRNDVPQLQVEGKKAALGPQGRLPCFAVRLTGPIRRAATMTCDLPAHSRYRSL